MTNCYQKQRGFTLIEMLLSLALIGILAGIGVPVYQSLQGRNNLDVAANASAQTLRRAQTLSRAVERDSSWGVYAQTESITLFRGTSYATRDSGFDEAFEIAPAISVSGLQEVVFTKFSGDPQATGTLTLINTSSGETKSITVNAKGMVDF